MLRPRLRPPRPGPSTGRYTWFKARSLAHPPSDVERDLSSHWLVPCMFPMNPNRNRPSADPSSAVAQLRRRSAVPTLRCRRSTSILLRRSRCSPYPRARASRAPERRHASARVVFPNTRVRASPRHVVRAISSTRCASARSRRTPAPSPSSAAPRASLALVDASSDDKRRAAPARAGSARARPPSRASRTRARARRQHARGWRARTGTWPATRDRSRTTGYTSTMSPITTHEYPRRHVDRTRAHAHTHTGFERYPVRDIDRFVDPMSHDSS